MKGRTVLNWMHRRILDKAGLPNIDQTPAELRRSTWNKEFEEMMRARLVMGAMRYDHGDDPDKPEYDNCGSMVERIALYIETGDKEMLVDVANLALVEYAEGNHPKAHFGSTGEDSPKVQVK